MLHGFGDRLPERLMQLQTVIDVERVIHADADRQHHDRQGGNGQADLQLLHEPVADEGPQGQRQAADQHGAPIAVDDEHQQCDSAVDIKHHRQLAAFHFFVDRRDHASVTGRQTYTHAGLSELAAQSLGRGDHSVNGGCLVIGEKQMHRGHTAIRPHHAGYPSHLGGHR